MAFSDATKVALRDILSKDPGFLKELEDSAPQCAGETIEARAVSGSERQGWQNCIKHIKDGCVEGPEEERSPFLADDKSQP